MEPETCADAGCEREALVEVGFWGEMNYRSTNTDNYVLLRLCAQHASLFPAGHVDACFAENPFDHEAS